MSQPGSGAHRALPFTPPVYRPQSPGRPSAAAPAPAVVQRQVPAAQAVSALADIMKAHNEPDWYKQAWSSGAAKQIAGEVASQADTTKDNLRSRLQAHRDVAAVLLRHRLQFESHLDKNLGLAPEQQLVLDAVEGLTFYHVTKKAADVRAAGLDPARGGTAGGLSDEKSLVGKRAENLAASKGKVFVTRKWSEARQYMGDGSHVLRVLIPEAIQSTLQTDPDSQFGLFSTGKLVSIDGQSRQLDWWGYAYLRQYLFDRRNVANAKLTDRAIENVPGLYASLIDAGAFLPGKAEPVRTLPTTVPMMSDDEIERQLALLKQRLG